MYALADQWGNRTFNKGGGGMSVAYYSWLHHSSSLTYLNKNETTMTESEC